MRFSSLWCTHRGDLQPGLQTNQPSPVTVAYWKIGLTVDITFDEPVNAVGFMYASLPGVALHCFDADGGLVGSASGAGNAQPDSPRLRVWNPLLVEVEQNVITRATIIGARRATIIDDFAYGMRLQTTPYEVDIALFSYCHGQYKTLDGPGSFINLHSNRKILVAILSSDSFDPLTVDVTTVTLGDPLMDGTCQPEGSDSWDVNQDDLPDLVLHFRASALAEAGALTVDSTEVEIKGETVDGQSILRIAPVEVRDL